MAKDPAFLFYPNDWIGGTMGMTFEEKGAYMELLMYQFNVGHMEGHMVGRIVGQLWDNIKHKFKQDDAGLWFNERLENEKEKRKLFTDSRKNNLKGINQHTKNKGHKGGHMTKHMENENENINENKSIGKKGGTGGKQKDPYFTIARDAWLDFYKTTHPANGLSPTFDAIAGAKLKSIVAKLKLKTEEAGQVWDEQAAAHALGQLLITASKMKWLRENFNLKNIDSQFDQIIQHALKNNHAANSKAFSDIFDNW